VRAFTGATFLVPTAAVTSPLSTGVPPQARWAVGAVMAEPTHEAATTAVAAFRDQAGGTEGLEGRAAMGAPVVVEDLVAVIDDSRSTILIGGARNDVGCR